jgi:alpha 1,3-glucosidase
VLDKDNSAKGELYIDDGETFDYEAGAYIHRRFAFDGKRSILTSTNAVPVGAKSTAKLEAYLKSMTKVRVEKVIIVGAPKAWKGKTEVTVMEEGAKESARKKTVPMEFHAGSGKHASWAVVRDPKVGIGRGWKIDFS